MNIEQLEAGYDAFTNEHNRIATGIAKSMSHLDLKEVKDSIAEAALQMQDLVATPEPSALSRIPFIGKYIAKAGKAVDEEKLRTASIQEVVDHLFNSLSDKKDNIMRVMESMYELQGRLKEEAQGLLTQEALAEELIANESGIAVSRAKNLLVQIKDSLIKIKDRIQIISGTIASAEASAIKISSMLPSLRGELITELAISGGLKELDEFREIFNATVDVIETVNVNNSKNMQKIMLDVVDLAVSTPRNLARLEDLNSNRTNFTNQLKEKMLNAEKARDIGLAKLTSIQKEQNNLLGYSGNDKSTTTKK